MIGTGEASVWDTVILARYDSKEDKEYVLFTKESVEVPGMGLGESYTGLFGKVHTARWLLVKKTLNTGRGPYLRGPTYDVTLHQYGACDICRSFVDAVCVTAPATAICIRKQ